MTVEKSATGAGGADTEVSPVVTTDGVPLAPPDAVLNVDVSGRAVAVAAVQTPFTTPSEYDTMIHFRTAALNAIATKSPLSGMNWPPSVDHAGYPLAEVPADSKTPVTSGETVPEIVAVELEVVGGIGWNGLTGVTAEDAPTGFGGVPGEAPDEKSGTGCGGDDGIS